ncbi:AEC family transporter [Thauera chlorobenzoica]|uniref:Auxin Efflux Carrier n=1 Tax=Thauera chlorobenzoica TaxID=96773 RepID=A0A1H5UI43_9RHOO|nr:AEC family transporter [Thauera chlorobenzoica]APR03625.1 Auxin Efflux Carrier [Thauera chlorobenzoica]SEF74700.1 hypothetical protein SAMN05216242_10519 [Thauera chlorobenzoica]
MLDILAITTPVFILIGAGFGAVRAGLFSSTDVRAMGRFVIQFALPAMLFKTLSQRSIGEIMNLRFLLAYLLGSLLACAAVALFARYAARRAPLTAVLIGMGGSMSNSIFLGLPIALQVVGPVASVIVALVVMVENLMMLPLLLAAAESLGKPGAGLLPALLRIFERLLKNPLVIAISAGFLASLLELTIPTPAVKAIDLLSVTSAGVALFVVGGNLARAPVGGMLGDVGLIVFAKLVLHPAAVVLALLLVPGIEPAYQAVAVLIACVPMMSIYPIFGQQYGQENLCSAALVVTTVVSFASITLWIWALGRAGLLAGAGLG